MQTWRCLAQRFVQDEEERRPETPRTASSPLPCPRTTSRCTSACACSASPSPWPGSWSATSRGWCPTTQSDESHRCGGQWPGLEQDHPETVVTRWYWDDIVDWPWPGPHQDMVCLWLMTDDPGTPPCAPCSSGWTGSPPPCRAPCPRTPPGWPGSEDTWRSWPEICWLLVVQAQSRVQMILEMKHD